MSVDLAGSALPHGKEGSRGSRWLAGARGAHKELMRNAASLFNATLLTSVLGFAFWAVAARTLPERSVGYGSAAVSVMTFLGTIGMFGMGTLLIGELPRLSARRGALTAAATVTASVGAALLAVGFVLIAPLCSESMRTLVGGFWRGGVLVVGVTLTSATLVLDQATIGVLRGGIQLVRNAVFAVGKLLLLLALALVISKPDGGLLLATWVGGIALSVLALAIQLRRSGSTLTPTPDWRLLRSMRRTAGAHNALNLAVQGPRLLLPVVVTIMVSADANAGFYVAYMIVSFLYIVPTHLSTVLFAVVAKDPSALRTKLRFTLKLSAAIGLAGMLVLLVAASPVLHIFGSGYAPAVTSLQLLTLGYLPMTIKLHYIAVSRASNRIGHAAWVLAAGGLLELGCAAFGAHLNGLTGLTIGYLVACCIEAAITGPTVARGAIYGRIRPAVTARAE